MVFGDKMDKTLGCCWRLVLLFQGFHVFKGVSFGTISPVLGFGGQNSLVLSTLACPGHCNARALVKFAWTKVGGVLSCFVQLG